MRVWELLAIAAFCPLAAGLCVGCERIVQPVGEYRAEQSARGMDQPSRGQPTTTFAGATDGGAPYSTNLDAGAGVLETLDAGLADPNTATWPPTTWPPPGGTGRPTGSSCTPNVSFPAERQRLDMYIIMDANVTLPYTGLWEFATDGLRQFLRDRSSQGLGVGIRYFGVECDPDTYDAPNVEVDLLPGNTTKLIDSTLARMNFNASPMTPALRGGIQHQRRRALQHPTWKQVVVLVTDGFTQDYTCFRTEQDVERAATDGFNTVPSIETHVIGFGVPPSTSPIADDIIARFLPLDTIADRGGTKKAQIVTTSDNPKDMKEAFERVRRAAQPCQYLVPPDVDPPALSFYLTPGGELPRVDNPAGCGNLPGWYYDDPQKPTNIVLCLASCRAIRASDAQTPVLLGGCPPLRR